MLRKAKTCVYSILESLLKRKWFLSIMRLLSTGSAGVDVILREAPDIPVNVLNGRLRTLLRYGLVARSSDRLSQDHIIYSLTDFGKRVSRILAEIDKLNQEYKGASFHSADPEGSAKIFTLPASETTSVRTGFMTPPSGALPARSRELKGRPVTAK